MGSAIRRLLLVKSGHKDSGLESDIASLGVTGEVLSPEGRGMVLWSSQATQGRIPKGKQPWCEVKDRNPLLESTVEFFTQQR